MMALAFGHYVHPDDIPTEGISKITKADIDKATADGCKIKLIASAKNEDGKLTYSVKPVALPTDHPLASVSNEFNAVFVKGNAVGELMFYGKGAGPCSTVRVQVHCLQEVQLWATYLWLQRKLQKANSL